jgi:hypothetical protein
MERKTRIPAPIYTRYGTNYTILGIASCLSGNQAGLPVATTGHVDEEMRQPLGESLYI